MALEGFENFLPAYSGKIDLAITVDRLLDELAETKPEWSMLVEMKFFLGLTDEEAADAMGIKLRSMQRIWSDARRLVVHAYGAGHMPKAQDDDLVMSLVEQALSQPPDTARELLRYGLRRATRNCSARCGTTCAGTSVCRISCWIRCFRLCREHRFEPGELLADRFRIVREVAQGGMGIVYEALDEKLERRIALKCAKSGFRKRLPPEVRHASEDQPSQRVQDFRDPHGIHRGGEIDFLTMEFLEGETLAAASAADDAGGGSAARSGGRSARDWRKRTAIGWCMAI